MKWIIDNSFIHIENAEITCTHIAGYNKQQPIMVHKYINTLC